MGLIPVLPLNLEIIVIVMAVVYTSISIIAQRKLANPKRMREIQAKVKDMQKEMTAMMKSNAPQDQLAAKQKEFMPLMGEQMKYSMKPMLVIFPLLLATYYVVIPMLPLGTTSVSSAKGLFFIIVFVLGMVSAIVIMLYDRSKTKKEQQMLNPESENSAAAPKNQ